MDEKIFIKNFTEQLLDYEGSMLTMSSDFRSLEDWDSLTGSAVQVMIYDTYNSAIPDSDFKNAKTIEDLYNLTLKNREK